MISKIKDMLLYAPRRAHIALIVLVMTPLSSFADSNSGPDTSAGLGTYLTSLSGGFDKYKVFGWACVGLVSSLVISWGVIMAVIIHKRGDNYRGKVTMGQALGAIAAGVIGLSASTYLAMAAYSLGAANAVANSTSSGMSGFTS